MKRFWEKIMKYARMMFVADDLPPSWEDMNEGVNRFAPILFSSDCTLLGSNVTWSGETTLTLSCSAFAEDQEHIPWSSFREDDETSSIVSKSASIYSESS